MFTNRRTMKYNRISLALALICSLYLSQLSATGKYHPDTGDLAFDCVELIGISGPKQKFALTLSPLGDDRYQASTLKEIPSFSQCNAFYNVKFNALVGELHIADSLYSVEFEFDAETEIFTLYTAEYLRLNDTSLWVVSDGVNQLYLGGTIHILHESDFPLPPAFLSAYEAAETVVFEYDPAIPITDTDIERFNLPEGESLYDYIPPGTEAVLNDFLDEFGVTLDDYARRRPEFFSSVLFFLGARSLGYGPGVEDYFTNLSSSELKPTGGLETVQDQQDAITEGNSNPLINWNLVFLLRLAYIQGGQLDVDLRQLIDEWRMGDTAPLAASNAQSKLTNPQQYESVIANRNRNWIPVIESYLQSPEVELVLGGFAHFAGPDNVLSLLEEMGYSVERYRPYSSPLDLLPPDPEILFTLF